MLPKTALFKPDDEEGQGEGQQLTKLCPLVSRRGAAPRRSRGRKKINDRCSHQTDWGSWTSRRLEQETKIIKQERQVAVVEAMRDQMHYEKTRG